MAAPSLSYERRRWFRERDVPFRFKLKDGSEIRAVAIEASEHAGLFSAELADKLALAYDGCMQKSDGFFETKGVTKGVAQDDPMSRAKHRGFLVSYTGEPAQAGLSESEASFVTTEMKTYWERHEQLQAKNKNVQASVIRLFSFMLLFAATPFSLQGFVRSGFSRVWGLGGIWLAIIAWFYCDRTFWSYGNHLFEQIFCLKHIAQIRKMLMSASEPYNLYSLRPTTTRIANPPFSGSPSRLSRRQIKNAAYFYKAVSFFTPMYLCLFICMVLFPQAMLGEKTETTWTPFLRVLLGFSGAFLLWIWVSMNSCYRLHRNAYRAEWITVQNPWPLFPKEGILELPSAQRYAAKSFSRLAQIATLVNLALFGWRYLFWRYGPMQGQGYAASYWWQSLDIALLAVTGALVIAWYAFQEWYLRDVLERAESYWYEKNPS